MLTAARRAVKAATAAVKEMLGSVQRRSHQLASRPVFVPSLPCVSVAGKLEGGTTGVTATGCWIGCPMIFGASKAGWGISCIGTTGNAALAAPVALTSMRNEAAR